MPIHAACRPDRNWQTRSTSSIGLVLAASLALCSPARANPEDEGAAPATPEPYVDRLIAGGSLTPLTSAGDERSVNTKGNVRSLVVELGGSVIAPKSRISGIDVSGLEKVEREAGILVSGRYQSDNFGLLGLDAQLHRGSGDKLFGGLSQDNWSGTLTLTSRDLPLGNGWLADATLGTTNAPVIGLVRRQTRFYLPSIPILGTSVAVDRYPRLTATQTSVNPEPIATFNLAVGEPGLLGGLRLSSFSGLSGLAVSAGGQVNLASGLSAGMQAIAIDKSRDPYAVVFLPDGNESRPLLSSSQAALGTIAYASDRLRVQANAIVSHRSGSGDATALVMRDGTAAGGWLEASLRAGRSRHSGGLYYFGPGLAWGPSALINNVYGGYYRFAGSTQRWRWTLNVDAIDSIDSTGSGGVIVNADLRRKVGFNTSIGVNSSLRIANGQTATQILGFVDFSTSLGSSRAEAGWSHDPRTDLYRLGFNQTWALPAWLPSGSRLTTQLSYERKHEMQRPLDQLAGSIKATSNSFGAAISAGATPFSGLSFDANLAYNSNGNSLSGSVFGPVSGAMGYLSSEEGRSFSANVVITARLSPSWSLSASYTDTTSRLTTLFGLPSSPLAPFLATQTDDLVRSSYHLRAGYLTLRYSTSAGRPKGSLGLRQFPVGGTGNLQGRIFLDANNNGKHEPAEAGAAGIVVILDGIQAVRTDASGFYRFEGVSDGPHRVTLNTDMLPLPWIIEPEDKRGSGEPFSAEVKIEVRSTLVLDIPATDR